MQARMPLLQWGVVVVVAAAACREAPPHIDPSRYAQAGQITTGSPLSMFAASLPSGESLPADVTADALQLGWFCLDLPPRIRPWLLPARGDGKLRVVQSDGQGGWQVAAVDLALRTATVEVALWSPHDAVVAQGLISRVGPAAEPTPTRALDPDALAPLALDAPSPDRTVAWLQWHDGARVVPLAAEATHVVHFAVDGNGKTLALIDAPPDATPTLWLTALATDATAVQVVAALHVWAVVGGGGAAIVRGIGALGAETQLVSLPDGATRTLGPDGRAVQAVGRGILIETWSGRLLRVAVHDGAQAWLRTPTATARLIQGGGQAAVELAEQATESTLLWFDGTALVRVTRLGPARWVAAQPMLGGVVAAILGRPRQSDGSFDPYADLSEVCVVARAVGGLHISLAAPAR